MFSGASGQNLTDYLQIFAFSKNNLGHRRGLYTHHQSREFQNCYKIITRIRNPVASVRADKNIEVHAAKRTTVRVTERVSL